MRVNVWEYLLHTASAVPEKTAVTDTAGSYTFAALRARAETLASHIPDGPDGALMPVAIYLPKSKECLAAMLAAVAAGHCYAPLDVKSPPERLRAIVEQLGAAHFITSQALAPQLHNAGVPYTAITRLEEAGVGPYATARWQNRIDTDPAYIMHTSGSTGVPKGVVITHRGIIDYIEWARDCFTITGEEVIGNQAPFFFDNSTLDIYLSLATGAALVIIPEEQFMFPVRLIEYLAGADISMVFWVPSVMVAVANTGALEHAPRSPLTKILFAGEVMPVKQLNYWIARYPQALFANLYGPTEITVDCTYYIVDRPLADDETLPIGVPCRNSDVLILDGDVAVTEPGQIGELCVRGTSLALGYWNAPDKTQAAFVRNPLNPHYPEVIYRTGDLVFRNERGEILFAGRKDSQIKHMGYRIELGEIEQAVSRLEEIKRVCALYNQTKKEITLFYEADGERPPVWFRQRLTAMLPKYMLPTAFHFMPAMPLNQNGKIDRQQLSCLLGE